MTSLAIDHIVLTFQWKAGYQMIKGSNVGNDGSGIRRRDERRYNKLQTQY